MSKIYIACLSNGQRFITHIDIDYPWRLYINGERVVEVFPQVAANDDKYILKNETNRLDRYEDDDGNIKGCEEWNNMYDETHYYDHDYKSIEAEFKWRKYEGTFKEVYETDIEEEEPEIIEYKILTLGNDYIKCIPCYKGTSAEYLENGKYYTYDANYSKIYKDIMKDVPSEYWKVDRDGLRFAKYRDTYLDILEYNKKFNYITFERAIELYEADVKRIKERIAIIDKSLSEKKLSNVGQVVKLLERIQSGVRSLSVYKKDDSAKRSLLNKISKSIDELE